MPAFIDCTDKVLILEHPMFLDRYTVGKIESQSAKTFQVTYWNTREKDWNEFARRRNIGWVRILGSVKTLTPDYLQETAEYLTKLYEHFDQTRTAALKQYNEAVQALGTKE